jgi:hypothetical protein
MFKLNPVRFILSVRPEIIIFILSIGVFSYFFQWSGWNQNSRFNLVRSMVEQKTFMIDKYHKNTGDKSKRDGHYYSDKAPGSSWLGALPYTILHKFVGGNVQGWLFFKWGLYLCTVFAIAIPSAISVSAIFYFFRKMKVTVGISSGLTLAYAFGTLTLPYSTMLFGHQLAAALLIVSFILIFRIKLLGSFSRQQLFVIGFLLGFSFVSDYTSFLAIITLLFYGAIISRWSLKAVVWVFFGMGVPAVMLMFYNWIAFGSVMKFSYHYSVFSDRHHEFFQGLTFPDFGIPFIILFTEYRGLFFYSPWLLLAVPGFSSMLKRKDLKVEGIVCLIIFISYVLFNSAYWGWHGGQAFGPRYIILSIPFLVLAAGSLWIPRQNNDVSLKKPTLVRGPIILFVTEKIFLNYIFVITAIFSIFMMFGVTIVSPQIPRENFNPLGAIFEKILNQQFVPNLGSFWGLNGFISFLPLGVFVCLISFWLFKVVRHSNIK